MIYRTTRTAPADIFLDIITVPGVGVASIQFSRRHIIIISLNTPWARSAEQSLVISRFVASPLLCLRSGRISSWLKDGVQIWRRTPTDERRQRLRSKRAPISILALLSPQRGPCVIKMRGESATRFSWQPEASSRGFSPITSLGELRRSSMLSR
jgi:hypothetical protein